MRLLRRIAQRVLGAEEARRIWSRIDIIGDIAIIKTPFNYPVSRLVPLAKALVSELPYVNTVWATASGVRGRRRLRELVFLAGEFKSVTVYKEHGCKFKVDVLNVYISPRLSYEHARLAKLVKPSEVVVNMFAGAGLFSIIIARHAKPAQVYSIDINPYAYRLMRVNVELNEVEDVVVPLLGDSKHVIGRRLVGVADRVLMPLPELASAYLPYALDALRGDGFVHVYEFVKAPKGMDPVAKAVNKYDVLLSSLGVDYELTSARIVRSVGPRRYQVVLDYHVVKHSA